ncbi:MAG: hypothetical protein QOH56_2787 [Pseudonocardiales bacterium]|nr:hypothetical protein [Pseudonocardiales bacterium]
MTEPADPTSYEGQLVGETCIDLGPGVRLDNGVYVAPPVTAEVTAAISSLIPNHQKMAPGLAPAQASAPEAGPGSGGLTAGG